MNKLTKKIKIRNHSNSLQLYVFFFNLKMVTSTLSDNWTENAPLTDDPCKLLAFTTSK